MTKLDRLIQEHAIYKEFFNSFRNRPKSTVGRLVDHKQFFKAQMFDVIERMEALDRGEPYYDPSWTNADSVLFTTDTSSLNNNV